MRKAGYAGSLKKFERANWNRWFSRELYRRTITAVSHRSLGLPPSIRKSARKGKIVNLSVIRGDIKRSRGHEIPMHRAAFKTVISGQIDVGANVTRDFRAS